MKTIKELNALKEEVKALDRKLAALNDDELAWVAGGSVIRVKDDDTLYDAVAQFKGTTPRDGFLAEARKREHYEKPSVKRKKKAEAARKRKH